MPRYLCLMDAPGIHLERGDQIPHCGFVAARIVKSKDASIAKQLATIELLKQWKLLFNRENRSGTPQVNVISCKKMRNPFKKLRYDQEFLFYSNSEEQQQKMALLERASKRWFRIAW